MTNSHFCNQQKTAKIRGLRHFCRTFPCKIAVFLLFYGLNCMKTLDFSRVFKCFYFRYSRKLFPMAEISRIYWFLCSFISLSRVGRDIPNRFASSDLFISLLRYRVYNSSNLSDEKGFRPLYLPFRFAMEIPSF